MCIPPSPSPTHHPTHPLVHLSMYLSIYILGTHTHTHTHTQFFLGGIYIYVPGIMYIYKFPRYIYIYIYISGGPHGQQGGQRRVPLHRQARITHAHTHTHTRTHARAHTRTHTHARTHTRTNTQKTHTHTHKDTHARTRTHARARARTHARRRPDRAVYTTVGKGGDVVRRLPHHDNVAIGRRVAPSRSESLRGDPSRFESLNYRKPMRPMRLPAACLQSATVRIEFTCKRCTRDYLDRIGK